MIRDETGKGKKKKKRSYVNAYNGLSRVDKLDVHFFSTFIFYFHRGSRDGSLRCVAVLSKVITVLRAIEIPLTFFFHETSRNSPKRIFARKFNRHMCEEAT